MKTFLLLVTLLSFGISTQAQLYVQPTSSDATYIYANDTFIYVNGDIELKENGAGITNAGSPSIALRNQSQLLQGNNTAQNKGNGEVSIYQEGTSDNFDYNFWSSPVGVAGTTSGTEPDGNSSFSMMPLEQTISNPRTVLESNTILANPNTYEGSVNNSGFLEVATYWLFNYKSNNGYAAWDIVQNTNRLEAGWGFSMKGVFGSDTTNPGETTVNNDGTYASGNGQRYDFRGRSNNGTITGVTVGQGQNSLVGNPYPSAFDLSYFLIQNSGVGQLNENCSGTAVQINRSKVTTGIAYFWESDPDVNSHYLEDYQGGYGMFSPMGTTCTAGIYMGGTFTNFDELGTATTDTGDTGDSSLRRRFSPVGQGFFVVGDNVQNSSDIVFNNEQRVYVPEGAANNSQFRSNEEESGPVPGIAINRTYEDVTALPQVSHIKLAVGVNDTFTRQLAIGFVDSATKGIDVAIDAVNRGPLSTDVSFDLEGAEGTDKENGFIINGVPFDESQWVPLMIKVTNPSEFRFKVFETVEFPYRDVLLYDAQTDLYHDILNDEALLMLGEDSYRDRFYIRFNRENTQEEETEEEEEEETTEEEETEEEEGSEETENQEETENEESEETENQEESEETTENEQSEEETENEESEETQTEETNTEETSSDQTETSIENDPFSVEEESPFIEESILESFTIVQNNANRQLEIYNPQNIEVSDVTLYDLTGKKVFNQMNVGGQSEYKFHTGNLASGVYVVQFVTQSGLRKGRKISIVN